MDEQKYSSYQVTKINRKNHPQKRTLLLTYSFLHNLKGSTPQRSIALSQIAGVVINSDNATEFILKVPNEYDYKFISPEREKIVRDLRTLICGDAEKIAKFYTWAAKTHEFAACLRRKMDQKEDPLKIPIIPTISASLRPLSAVGDIPVNYQYPLGNVPSPVIEKPLSWHPTRRTDIVNSNGTKYAAAAFTPSAPPARSWFNPPCTYPSLITIEQITWGSGITVYTKYCENGDLGHLLGLNHEGLPLDIVRLLAQDIAKALNFLHQRDIIFRDLRPSKVVISSNYEAKLLYHGFNRAKTEPLDASEHSEYYSPLLDESPDADWWSFGILVHEMIVGTVPLAALEKPVPLKVLPRDFDPGNDQARDLIEKLLKPERSVSLRVQGGEKVLTTEFLLMSSRQRDEAKRSLQMLLNRESQPAAMSVTSDDQFSVRSKRPS